MSKKKDSTPREQNRMRVTQTEYENRLDQLLQLKAMGYSASQLVKAAMQSWGLSERQAYRYLEDVKALEKRFGSEPPDVHCGRLINRMNRLFAQSYKENDIRTAILATEVELKIIQALGVSKHDQVSPSASGETSGIGLLDAIQALEEGGPSEES